MYNRTKERWGKKEKEAEKTEKWRKKMSTITTNNTPHPD